MQYDTTLIKDFSWLKVKKKNFGVVAVFSLLIFASVGFAQDQTPFLSSEASTKAAYQKYLKDQDKKSNEINYLLNLIEHSSLTFERNGQKGSGQDAVKLLKVKLIQYKNKIHTAEDFIEQVASFSSHTNKSYHVILPGGEKLLLKDLLYTELNKLRNRSNEESKSVQPRAGVAKL
jgi:hypothetical protein